LVDAWGKASRRDRDIDNEAAQLNVTILERLRHQWQDHVRPDTSMFTLQFTRPDETGYEHTERVDVEWEAPGRVRLALVRVVPRRVRASWPSGRHRGLHQAPNTLPALDALLVQLARRTTNPWGARGRSTSHSFFEGAR